MLDSLQDHAVKNVWCSPQQDNQTIIRPARLSPKRGTRRSQRVMWEDIPLPHSDRLYHVYQIGHVHPKLLGLLGLNVEWKSLRQLINDTGLNAQVYFSNGRIVPNFDCFFRWGRHRNLLLAVRDRSHFPEIREQPIDFRVYTNAYYASSRFSGSTRTYTNGRLVETTTDRTNLRTEFQNYQSRSEGGVFAYRNGYLVEDLRAIKVDIGDVIEFVYDASVDFYVDINVSDLRTFLSTLDSQTKYLIHYPGKGNERIEFQDDVDVYLIDKNPNNTSRYEGVYYHRGDQRALRMVTHKDYSMPVSFLNSLHHENKDYLRPLNDTTIRVYVRNAGYDRPLIYDDHRLFELYRLPDDQVLDAMLSNQQTLDLWSADTLENSEYTQLMRSRSKNLPTDLVQKAYGYNGISRVLGDTPRRTTFHGNWASVKLPPAFRYKATIYEYDNNGLLLGFYTVRNHVNYPCRNANTKYVETVVGHATQQLDVTFGQRTKTAQSHLHYRAYLATLNNDQPLWDWEDISHTQNVTRENGEIKISDDVDLGVFYPAIMSDDDFIGYELQLYESKNVMRFSVMVIENHDGTDVWRESTIPPRRLDLWLNGYSLIQGLDYTVDWPQVVISNSQYFDSDAQTQDVVIRAMGFSDENLEMETHREQGFIQHGYLGSTQRYDIRDDIVYSLIINGRLVMRDQVEWAQYSNGAQVGAYPDGSPYAIKETIIALRNELANDVYTMRDQSRSIDNDVANYMDMYYDQPDLPDPPMIIDRYAIYSPFMARVIHLMQEDFIDEATLIDHYNQNDIENWFVDHWWILDHDPGYQGVDTNFVTVYPHPYAQVQTVTIYQYQLIKRINDWYFGARIPLSSFLQATIPQDA